MKKKKENKQEKHLAQNMTECLDIPYGLMPGSLTAEIQENRQIIVHGQVEIIRYATEQICLKSGKYLLSLTGKALEINCLSSQGIVVIGTIEKLEYIYLQGGKV